MRILVISNLYPNEEYPHYGTFVRNFYEYMNNEIENMGNTKIERIVLNKKKGKLNKIIDYLNFYLRSIVKLNVNEWDIVYVHYISHSSIPVILSPKKFKIISNIHGSDYIGKSKWHSVMNVFGRVLLNKSDLIVVPSKHYLELIKNDFPKKLIIESASGGVNREVFYKDYENYSENDILNLGYVGRIDKGKGWDTLLYALKKIENEPIKLTIIGSGKEEKILKKMLTTLNLSQKVNLIPAQPQIKLKEYYNKFDVLVFPSENESLGLVGLEAMACGVPVIGSDIGGIKTYLIDGYNGLLFENKNINSLSVSIIRFLRLSDESRKKLGKNAYETSLKYDSKEVNRKLLDELLKVVQL